MKTLLLIFATIFALQISAQNDTSSYNSYIPYVVGSIEFPEYDIEVRNCHINESIILDNGKRIAGLSYIIIDKDNYIGGKLVFGKDTTIITDIVITTNGDGALFTVKGKSFNMYFTLVTGYILKLESKYTTFNTKGKGVWTIYKKS